MSDEKQKYENIKAALGDGKTRLIYVGGLVIVIAVTLFSIGSFSMKKSTPRGGVPASEVPKLPSAQNNTMPGATPKGSTQVYDKLLGEQNQREAELAKQEGGSAIPVLRAGVEQKPTPQVQPQPQQTATAPQNQGSRNDEEQKRQQAITARAQAMKNQVNLLVAAWSPKEHISMPVKESQRADAQGQNSLASQGAAGATPARTPTKKAGDTCYAELDTAVNTDEPSPVTATIQQCGELDQAKLVGKVEMGQNNANAQKAGLHFTTINVPGQTSSLPVDAYAMDEATRRTALASDVDNHYFLRYGSLFASAFVSGFGDALLKGGQDQQLVTTTTGAIVQQKAYDTRQLVLAGVGNIGKQAGANMGSVFNRPSTITINAGIGIGILFMNDLTLK